MLNRANLPIDVYSHANPTGPDEDPLPVASTERGEVTTVQISSLVFGHSPRLSGEDPKHSLLLAESDDELPPITVHRPTMRVIDGMHRVRAALLNGKSVIQARLLDCDEEVAFVLAVTANITHGLPLSQADRRAAAARFIAVHPNWSDRAVAASTGLSDKTVARIRDSLIPETSQSNTRLGRDGRRRPINSELQRRHAAALISEKPDAGLREISRATGLSVATVRDVRQRVERHEDPVPPRYRPVAKADPPPVSRLPRRTGGQPPRFGGHDSPQKLLEKLRNDPALRFNDAGRRTLRWLHQHAVQLDGCDGWEDVGLNLPEHCAPVVADLARTCADVWMKLAEQLEQQADDYGDSRSRRAD
ncbi:hypothetical protein [Flindersiella endophytica]